MKISSIVAMGKNRVIGKDNDLMWKIPSETKHYKDIVGDHYFAIGRKNYEGSLDYINHERALVLTTNEAYESKAASFTEIEELISYALACAEKELFILGGEQIYNLFMPFIDTLHLSIVDFDKEGDSYFPPHEDYQWIVKDEFFKETDEETPLAWHYQKLEKKS